MIRIARYPDLGQIVPMMYELFPEDERWLLKQECITSIMRKSEDTLLYFDGEEAVGFAMVSLRNDHVEGALHKPTGYLEALFIAQLHRKKGLASELVAEAEAWCLKKGCKQMGSDVDFENETSQQFHEAYGFKEVNRIVAFIKELDYDLDGDGDGDQNKASNQAQSQSPSKSQSPPELTF